MSSDRNSSWLLDSVQERGTRTFSRPAAKLTESAWSEMQCENLCVPDSFSGLDYIAKISIDAEEDEARSEVPLCLCRCCRGMLWGYYIALTMSQSPGVLAHDGHLLDC